MKRDSADPDPVSHYPEIAWRKACLTRLAKGLRVPLAELAHNDELVFDCIYHLGGPEIWNARGSWSDAHWSKALDLARFGLADFVSLQASNEARSLYRSKLSPFGSAPEEFQLEKPWLCDKSSLNGRPK